MLKMPGMPASSGEIHNQKGKDEKKIDLSPIKSWEQRIMDDANEKIKEDLMRRAEALNLSSEVLEEVKSRIDELTRDEEFIRSLSRKPIETDLDKKNVEDTWEEALAKTDDPEKKESLLATSAIAAMKKRLSEEGHEKIFG